MDEREIAIRIEDVSKIYKLYNKPSDRLKEALGFSRKKRYKEHYALKHVDLTIRQGDTVGIIGTNGSGKSTILKIITGVLNTTEGKVQVNGRISALLELGAGFNMEYNGIENIYLNGTMIGFSEKEIDAKLQDILDFADIGEYVYQPVKTYSSGMFVRLAFAVAINIEPEILIVDEALSVGDVFFQAKCYHKFEEFKQMGKTILFVSHDLSSISKYCDRVVLLGNGVKLGEGGPKEMIDAYKQVLVGQYSHDQSVDNLAQDEDVCRLAAQASEGGTARGRQPEENGRQAGGRSGSRRERQPGTGRRKKGGQAVKAPQRQEGQQEGSGRSVEAGVNPQLLEYGDQSAQIVSYFITDEKGVRTSAVLKGSPFTLHMSVKFRKDVPAPIFAFTIKDVHGTEITGTNTMIEKSFLDSAKAGETIDVAFTQKMSLQGGEYLLSLGVTGYRGDVFEVYHRLYDALNITVISDKNTVGYFDMDSAVTVAEGSAAAEEGV